MKISIAEIEAIVSKELREIEDYRWIHPSEISGYDIAEVQRACIYRLENNFYDNELSGEPVDQTITDYLCGCINMKRSLIDANKKIPAALDFSFIDYIEALIFMVGKLNSSYASTLMGTQYDESFFTVNVAKTTFEKLKLAFKESSNHWGAELIRGLFLDMFRMIYPWSLAKPYYSEALSDADIEYLIQLRNIGPVI